MSHAKQASTKRKRSINAVPVLSAAGLSLSLASGASAAIGKPAADRLMPKTGVVHEITLCEEEISDVSLATFYVFDNERVGPRRGVKAAAGGCGCACGGCSFGASGGDGGSTVTYSAPWPVGRYSNQPNYSTKTVRKTGVLRDSGACDRVGTCESSDPVYRSARTACCSQTGCICASAAAPA